MEYSEIHLQSSERDLKDFFNHSVIWKDLVMIYSVWLKDVRDALENPDLVLSERHLDRLGGNAEALRKVTVTNNYLFEEDENDGKR